MVKDIFQKEPDRDVKEFGRRNTSVIFDMQNASIDNNALSIPSGRITEDYRWSGKSVSDGWCRFLPDRMQRLMLYKARRRTMVEVEARN